MGYIYSSMFKKESDKIALINNNEIYSLGNTICYMGRLEGNKVSLREAGSANAFIKGGLLYRIGENDPIANAAEGEVRTGSSSFGTPVLWYDKDVDDNVALAVSAIILFPFELNATSVPSEYGYEEYYPKTEEEVPVRDAALDRAKAADENKAFLGGVLKAILLGVVLFASGLIWIRNRSIIFKGTPTYVTWGIIVFLICFAIIMCKNYFTDKEKLVECILIPYLTSACIAAIASNVIWCFSSFSELSVMDFFRLLIIPVAYSVFFALPGIIEAIVIGIIIICYLSAKSYLIELKESRDEAKKGRGPKMKKNAVKLSSVDKTFLGYQISDDLGTRKKITKFEVILYIISIGLAFEITVACSMFVEQIWHIRYTEMQSMYLYGCTFVSSYVALAFNKKGIFKKILLYSCGFVFGFLISEIWIDIIALAKAYSGGYQIRAFSSLRNMGADKMLVLYTSTLVAFILGIGANMYIRHERKRVKRTKF